MLLTFTNNDDDNDDDRLHVRLAIVRALVQLPVGSLSSG